MAFTSFLDARRMQPTRFEADVCIVGSGAAGITLAKSFVRTRAKVVLLEAGGLSVDPKVDALSRIDATERPYPDHLRLRLFGGTTNHWGGHCAPLQPDDLEGHPWIAHTGWPYGYAELEPYYRRAHQVLDLGDFDYDARTIAQTIGKRLFPFTGDGLVSTASRYNAVRFGMAFGDELDRAPNITPILHAEASSIELADAVSDEVSHIACRTAEGGAFEVAARYFVIACGGIENPRLLLMSDRQRPAGLGNHADMVGRFFQEHLWLESGFIMPKSGEVDLDFYTKLNEHPQGVVRGHLALTTQKVAELGIPKYRSEILAASIDYVRAWRLKNRGLDMDHAAALLSRPYEFGAAMKCRDAGRPTGYVLGNYTQQVPNPESRVTLSSKRDPLGRPQPELQWRLSALDHEGVVKAHRFIAERVGGSDFGRMHIEIKPEPGELMRGMSGGAHHMGTTRMHIDPKRGVTDGDGRVHHTRNLYMAGSSLFPNCGWPNPTLTIVATSLRMADHLKARLRKDGLI